MTDPQDPPATIPARPVEAELKYRMSDVAHGERFLAADALAGFPALGEPRTVANEDRYVDTADGSIARAGWAARFREGEGTARITLKALRRHASDEPGAALHRRDELEGPASPGAPATDWPASEARGLLLDIAGTEELQELVTIRQVRRRRDFGDGASRVELSLDDVEVIAGGGVVERFAELELELRAGDDRALHRLAELLSEVEQLVPAETSKLERALEALRREGVASGPATDTVLETLAHAAETEAMATPPVSLVAEPRPVAAPAPDSTGSTPESPEDVERRRQRKAAKRAKAADARAAAAAAGAAAAGAAAAGAVAADADGTQSDAAEEVDATPPRPPSALERLANLGLKSPGATAEDHLAEAGRKVLRFHLARMVAREPGTRLGRELEELHAMRVATRRQRAAWRVFGDAFDPAQTKRHRTRLRDVAAKLGAVRDMDVLIEAGTVYRDAQSPTDAAAFQRLIDGWHRQRERSRAILLKELDSRIYRKWVAEYATFAMTEGEGVLPVGPVDPHRVRDRMPSRIWAAYEQLRAYEPVLRWADVPTIHDLRIASKWLRYTLEFVREALGRDAGPLIEKVVALQDHLGLMNDADVAANLARVFLVERAGTLTEAESAAVGRYLVDREREVARLRRTMGPAWRGVSSLAFRRSLGRVVAGL